MSKRKGRHPRQARKVTAKAVRGRKKARRRSPARARRRSTAIDVAFKGVLAVEPPRNSRLNDLDPAFRVKLQAALADLAARGTPFKFVEGFRTVERQQWLFGSGRPDAGPFGRSGSIVTHRDGVRTLSNHQGTGTAGSGKAADCYPLKADGRVHIPAASDSVWQLYADAVI